MVKHKLNKLKETVKTAHKSRKNRKNKVNLVFDENKRREFLTGFHKRKLQRKKEAKEKLDKDLKEERKRLKNEAKESYKKMVVSHRPLPELENLLKEEYEEDDVTVKIEELSTSQIALQNNWIGPNQPAYEAEESEKEQVEEGADASEEVPGMSLKKSARICETAKDLKKILKKEATKKVKKSKVFQRKNEIEKRKQRKKSMQLKKQRLKHHDKANKRK